jgi:Fe-S oxidoreductase
MAVTPDANVTFWYGCNMARHGEIVRLATRILGAVGVDAAPAGGPGYCCGSPQEKNARIAAGMAERTVQKFNEAGRETVVTWCPSCHMNMDDFMAPVTEAAFETQHITELLVARRERLRPHLTTPVAARVLLHAHHGFHGRVPVNTDVPALLSMIPGLTVLDHPMRVPGHMCSAIAPVPGQLAQAHRETLAAMQEVGADTLATIFHSCHRDAVALERGRPIRVVNWVHLLAEAMGLAYTDDYKLWRNAEDPRVAIGAARIDAAGDAAFERLVEPELRRPPAV